MTESPEPSAAEPTNADLLAFMTASFGHVMTEISGVKADVAQVRAEVVELKVEFGLLEARVDDAHRAILRHANDPNAHHDAA